MTRLSLATLAAMPDAVERPAYDPAAAAIGVVHLGPGAFFRAHVAAYLDSLLAHDASCAVSAVALRSSGLRDALAPQDGLYTLATMSEAPRLRVIGALRELLVAGEQRATVLARLAAPETRLVTLTVTEKGYCLAADGTLDVGNADIGADLDGTPTSAIGWLVAGLAARRARGLPPFVAMSCDNLGHNGAKLKAAVIGLASRLDTGLADWIEAGVQFPATMVDSITPATDDALRARVRAAIGLDDAWPVQREPFTEWVVEAVPGLPDLARVGATVVEDVAPYELAKLRLLNGAHSTLAYMGLPRGHATVAEAMADAPLRTFVETMMREDIAPTLRPPPSLDLGRYIGDILDRFGNPAIAHRLEQIAWDGTQKLPYRLIDTIRDLDAAGRDATRPLEAVMAWMTFVRRRARDGGTLVDPLASELSDLAGRPAGAMLALPMLAPIRPLLAEMLARNEAARP